MTAFLKRALCALLVPLALAACKSSTSSSSPSAEGGDNATVNRAAVCANMSAEPFTTRNELAAGTRNPDAGLLLRFIQLTDDHIIDDDGQAINGASFLDPLYPAFEAAQRLQEEYSDEVFNDMIAGINACHQQFPAEFAVVTGDSADLTTLAETRRFIDNLDGAYDQLSAFEAECTAALLSDPLLSQTGPLLAALIDEQCTRFTGRGTADTQTPDLDPEDPAVQFLPTRMALQLAAAEQAATSGRDAEGNTDPARQTATRSPGLPQVLRCNEDEPGCINVKLAMPWYVAFGNHDGYIRGTVALDTPVNEISQITGRRYLLQQNEFIREFFNTSSQPRGHGFNHVLPQCAENNDGEDGSCNPNKGRNDGYYAFDAGSGRLRMIVLNTIVDGKDTRLPDDMLRNPFALSDGSLDQAQFDWMKGELDAAYERRQLVMVFSHHPDLTFAEFGMFAGMLNIEVTAAQLDAELASWPHVIAWVAGHTHVHRVRPFAVVDGEGSNGDITTAVECSRPGCNGFWQIETASLIDHPQQQRLIEIFDNGDGTGTIRGPVLVHALENPKYLAEWDDRCALYLSDPEAVQAGITEANLDALCTQGGTREGRPEDRNVELMFRMPVFE